MEDAEPVIQIPVGLPCLERGRLVKKESNLERGVSLLKDTPFTDQSHTTMLDVCYFNQLCKYIRVYIFSIKYTF